MDRVSYFITDAQCFDICEKSVHTQRMKPYFMSCKLEMNLVCDEESIVVSPMHVTYVCLEIKYIKHMKGFPELCYCTGVTPQV